MFNLYTGNIPYCESCGDVPKVYDHLFSKKESFWAFHKQIKKEGIEYNPEFTELFELMTSKDLYQRPTIQEVKAHAFFQDKPVYTQK